MSRSAQPLPDQLGERFTLGQATRLGVSTQRLRRDDLTTPVPGVRSHRDDVTLLDRLRSLALVLPRDALFGYSTAAQLWGLPLPLGVDPEPIHVITRAKAHHVNRPGVIAHRRAPLCRQVIDGVAVTSPTATWGDLARRPRTLERIAVGESVMVADALFSLRLATAGDLQREVVHRHRARGVRTLRTAAKLARPGSASPMESLARVTFVLGGLPEPRLNFPVSDAAGQFIACCDFVWARQRVIVEYDGDHHRTDRGQWQRDHYRLRRLRDAGWTVLVITADDVLRRPDELVNEIRHALLARGA